MRGYITAKVRVACDPIDHQFYIIKGSGKEKGTPKWRCHYCHEIKEAS